MLFKTNTYTFYIQNCVWQHPGEKCSTLKKFKQNSNEYAAASEIQCVSQKSYSLLDQIQSAMFTVCNMMFDAPKIRFNHQQFIFYTILTTTFYHIFTPKNSHHRCTKNSSLSTVFGIMVNWWKSCGSQTLTAFINTQNSTRNNFLCRPRAIIVSRYCRIR